jgi:uridine kinase
MVQFVTSLRESRKPCSADSLNLAKGDSMTPFLIGVAGPTCSGKTTLTRSLATALHDATIVSIDSYYKGMENISLDERKKCNFDSPDAIDQELLLTHIRQLAIGASIDCPVYAFDSYTRLATTKRIDSARFVLIEGLFTFYWESLRRELDLAVFVTASREVSMQRRLERDVRERGRSPEAIRAQFDQTVWPGAERFVLPSQEHADVILSGSAGLHESMAAISTIIPDHLVIDRMIRIVEECPSL